MTTIAFDGKVLAAERKVGHLGKYAVIVPNPKIVVGDGRVVACGGNMTDALALARWWVEGSFGKPPEMAEKDAYLVGYERGATHATYVDTTGHELVMPSPYAEGSGGAIAYGAMLTGALAVESVRAATMVDPFSGGPIDYVIVAEDPWVIRQAPDRPAWDGNYTFPVRREGDGLDEVRLAGRANGGSAPHSPHEGQA